MDDSHLNDEDLVEDGLILSEDDILQVIEPGDDQPVDEEMDDVGDDQSDVEDDPSFNYNEAVVAGSSRDDAVSCFKNHKGAVFSARLCPGGDLAVTGGEDDKGFVWKTADCSVLFECTGHKDSVTCTGFSHDGKYVATGDMSGLVQVWKVSSGERVWSYECTDLEWLLWHTNSAILLAGTSDGLGWMWKIPSNDFKCFQGLGVRNICGVLFPDGRRACFGYESGRIAIWDLKTATTTFECKVHSSALTCVAAHHDNNLLLTSSEDCTAQLVSTHSRKIVHRFEPGPVGEKNTVETVGFCNSMPLAATGSLNGTMATWDIPTQQLRHKCEHPEGVVKIHWCQSSPLLYTACLDGIVRLWDARNGNTVCSLEGHSNQLLDLDVTSNDTTVVTACEDRTARIFLHHMPS